MVQNYPHDFTKRLNYLYWAFLKRNQKRLQNNPRLTMAYRQLQAMPAARTRQILLDARRFAGRISRTPGRVSIPQAG
jgi:deoxyribodipyrimidine photolyase-like uncharacterized protein